jgi:hypothetical protein
MKKKKKKKKELNEKGKQETQEVYCPKDLS